MEGYGASFDAPATSVPVRAPLIRQPLLEHMGDFTRIHDYLHGERCGKSGTSVAQY
jgi:hypothetical protein